MQLSLVVMLAALLLVFFAQESQQDELNDAIAKDITTELKKKAIGGKKYSVEEAQHLLEDAFMETFPPYEKDWVDLKPLLKDDKLRVDRITMNILSDPEVVDAWEGLVQDKMALEEVWAAIMEVSQRRANWINEVIIRSDQ